MFCGLSYLWSSTTELLYSSLFCGNTNHSVHLLSFWFCILSCLFCILLYRIGSWIPNKSLIPRMVVIPVTLQFSGGAELLFNNKKTHEINLTTGDEELDIRTLLKWMEKNLLTERPELFLQNESVRPGILVLVNDVDWELHDTANYRIQPNDRITFISTLHGG